LFSKIPTTIELYTSCTVKLVTESCLFVGVHTLTFHRCRAENPHGQLFTVDECSVGQVMNIEFAEVGYSESYSASANSPWCPWNNCTEDITNSIATMCNGHRSCNISQDLLIYPQGSALCALQRDANFINITLTCITGINYSIILRRFLFTII